MTGTIRTRRLAALAALLAAVPSARAAAQMPLVDTAFAESTPSPDLDLVIVRERAYGASGVDLAPYVPGAGVEDYVQSIYLRLFKGGGGPATVFQERVTFPPGVTVIGIVAGETALGGSGDDGALTATDALFAIAPSLADDYSAPDRGLEANMEELACIASANVAFITHNVTTGVDDVRILIDYGSSFPAGLAFDVETTAVSVPTGQNLAVGFQVGDPTGAPVAGSGDFGEVRGLLGVPLTAATGPATNAGFTIDRATTLLIARDGATTRVDAYDLAQNFPILSIFRTNGTPGTPRALVSGPLDLVIAVGSETGTASYDLTSHATATGSITTNPAGSITSATGLAGADELFYVARDPSGDSFVDAIRYCDLTILQSLPIAQATLAAPRGITDASDGMLYVLGASGELVRLDPSSGAATLVWTTGQSGYAEIGRDPSGGTLYLLRDTGVTATLDEYDVASGMGLLDVATFAERNPREVAGGPLGRVYVVGDGGSGDPRTLWGFDAATWSLELQTACVNVPGSLRGLTPLPVVPPALYCGPAEPNSTGYPATIRTRGTPLAGGPLELSAWGMANNQFGYFLVGQGTGTLFPVPGSSGRICLLGASIGRFNAFILNTGSIARFCVEVDTSMLPLTPVVSAQPGETWNFQAWYRDSGGTSNFTEGLAVTFQ